MPFGSAEYGLDISDFTSDGSSVIPLPVNRIRATHASYPVSVTVPASTNKEPNRAPWGLGANFVQFDAGSAKGTLRVSFDGVDGVAWRAVVVLTPASGQAAAAVAPLALDGGGAGSVSVPGFGSRWSRATGHSAFGIAFRAERKTVDKVVDRLRFHS